MAELRHKTKLTNTFRFKSFAERVNEIDIRRLALYHIGHENEELPEDNETYFHQTLKKWMVLNLTEEYAQFSRQCTKIVTLPQLLHQKDFVVDLLLEHLATATNLSLQPLLELLYVLARDLREEFYVYFQRVLDRLLCLLNSQDAEQLEWTLVCLAYLFKTLKPYLKRNIGVVFHAILPLLDEQRYEEHVTNFAVECFSFIARDVRDYRKFLDFVLETVVHEQVDSVQACGRLLFEIVRGVKGQFHSIAGDFLQFIFECLVDVDEQRKSEEQLKLLCDIVEHAVEYLLAFIQPQQMTLFWTKLCAVSDATHSPDKLANLVRVYIQVVKYRDGRYLAEMDVVVPSILHMLDNCMKSQDGQTALRLLAELVSRILLCGSSLVTQLDTSRLVKKVLALEHRDIYDEFILQTVEYVQFDIFMLPALVAYFEQYFDHQAFQLMAQVLLKKQPFPTNATDLQKWSVLKVQMRHPDTLHKIEEKLETLRLTDGVDLEEQLLLLVIVPHLSSLTHSCLATPLQKSTEDLLVRMEGDDKQDKDLDVLIILLATQLQLHFELSKEVVQRSLAVLLEHPTNLRALGCLDQLLDRDSNQFINRTKIMEALVPLLSHHQHDLRLTAAHCLQTLHQSRGSALTSPYHIFYAAECIEPTIHSYREQLLQLQKLEPIAELYKSFTEESYKEHCVRFLLGALYQNFKYVWEPVLCLLEEYSKVLDTDSFWAIYHEKLQSTAQALEWMRSGGGYGDKDTLSQSYWSSAALNELFPPAAADTQLTYQQLLNYRNLLWLRLPKFGQLIELKNRELITLFMKFIEEEYRPQLETRENRWDISVNSQMDSNLAEDEEDPAKDRSVRAKRKPARSTQDGPSVKTIVQTLQSKLSVLAAYVNPKALYREPELWRLYMQLLTSGNVELQKGALDCIMAYKSKALVPYKEQLYAFVDEHKFKEELVNFKVDAVSESHREQLMQILLRLLYGKMITRGTQRSLSGQVRKGLILRFLGQCKSSEIEWFLQMAFGLYTEYTDDNIDLMDIPSRVHSAFRLTAVWSGRKLQSVVNLLELIRKEFGGLMETHVHCYMLKLLVFVGSVCNEVLQLDPSLLHAKMPTVFRNVRHMATQSLVNFFAHIEEFDWSASVIACLTEVFVWPTLAKLPQDSIHTPTALLKLLLQWGERPSHMGFLNQKCEQSTEPIFHYLIALLLNEKAKPAVRKPIMALIERMLVVAEENEAEYSGEVLAIIRPYLQQLLQYLKVQFSRTRGPRRSLEKRDLNVLALITRHVEDAETCDSLLQLLLPLLISKSQMHTSTEVVSQVITTLANLIKRLQSPETYLLKLAPLFEQVQEVGARKQLCELIADIARLYHKKQPNTEMAERLKYTARIVLLLNAWDKRWVEQPDYERRVDGFKELNRQLSASSGMNFDLGVLVIYNCFYFLRYDKDMGLRDNASEHLQLLLPHLAKSCAGDRKQLDYLMGSVFLNVVHRAVRDSSENVRNEGIRLLGVMARQCADTHDILQDFAPLCDAQDAEVDFFENITHLQVHRHGRALLRFCAHAATLTRPPTVRTLTQFLLPLASRYLLREQYAAKHTLIDAAIETIGVICQLVPWQHYHTILRYFLMKMRNSHEHQKQCVRIVVRILDAFHFDLSLAETDGQTLEQLGKEIMEERSLGVAPKEEEEEVATIDKSAESGEEQDEEGRENEVSQDDDAKLEAELENDNASVSLEEEEKECKAETISEKCLNRRLLLPLNASKRVLTTITKILIPTLNRSITEKSPFDIKHKINRKRLSVEREEEEILRVPIGLALVKLMQKLPKDLLDTSLPGVFMKVCTFLRSPLKSVRMLTRDILKKIMLTLGSKYLSMLMDHLQSLLTRGFQVHVLAVTVHGVLDALRDQLEAGDIESCMHNLLDVALNDIFGDVSVEKEIDKVTSHTPEAKPSAKSYLVLHIVARNIEESSLLDLLLPFKEHLARSKSRKLTLKIQDCFAKIVAGLVENVHISRESLLIFIYGTMSESISDLLPGTQRRVLSEQEKEQMRRARPDCYIIQPAPRMRSAAVAKQVKSNAQANAHILIEFGLEMLHIVLKRKKLAGVEYEPFLNPILPLLKDALKSTHIRVTTFALKCYATIWNEEYVLRGMREKQYIGGVVERMFEILKNFSTFGATKQEENVQLVRAAFKAMVALLRKCHYYRLTEDQIDELILYIEQDLHDGENQAMTFTLLKAMLSRKVKSKSIEHVMKRIADMSVVSLSDFVRNEARGLLVTYVMEYPLNKRVDQIVKFFTVQLCYSLPAGRQSAIDFLTTIIRKFPLVILAQRAELLYLSLGTRLVNDEDSECRKAVAACIELLITRLEKKDRQRLFDMTLLFFEPSNKPSVREMAASLCSRFLNAEKQSFAPRLKLVLPVVVARLTSSNPNVPGRFVRAPTSVGVEVGVEDMPFKRKRFKRSKGNIAFIRKDEENLVTEDAEEEMVTRQQRAIDHEIIQMQYCLLKIFEYCGSDMLENEEFVNIVDELMYESQRLLGHEHVWVRCNAAKIITLVLGSYDFALVGRRLCKLDIGEESECETRLDFIYLNPEYDLKSLVLDLCAQMIPGETSQPMIDEVVKVFLYVANMLRDVPFSLKKEIKTEDEEEGAAAESVAESCSKVNLNWLLHNIRFLVNKEVAKAPHCTSIRSALFTLFEGLITLLSVETLERLAPILLSCLVREMSEEDQNVDAELRQLALRVGSRLRKRIGSDVYDKLRVQLQTKLWIRRVERKRLIAQEKVHDPVRAAKRKVAMQERKKSAKKLKANVIRGKAADVKQKLKRRKRKAEEDVF